MKLSFKILLMMSYCNLIIKMSKPMKEAQQISHSGHTAAPILICLSPEKVFLNLPFILTKGKILQVGLPYMKSEKFLADSKTEAVRLLDIWDYYGFVYVKIQNLTTLEVDTLSWNLQCTSGFYLWSLADFQTLIKAGIKKGDTI